ncbi:C-type lectin domain family 12 member B-like isoform X2 [Pelmatolapia mariae]|uniref:C-type lectin domain family 12 member B-like isoform X2 n=1 Tax=Pelmatolapia mariae TaxID=158779 RepID=UPI002FE56F42
MRADMDYRYFKTEETVYDEVKVQNQPTEQTPVTNASAEFLPDKKSNSRCRHYQQLACCLGTLCIILVLGIIAVGVYHVTLIYENDETELNQLKENQTTLNAVNRNLTKLNNKLSLDNEDLKRNQTNLTLQMNNLTQAFKVLENEVTNLTKENQNLKEKNEQLKTQNKELEAEKKNLTEQIQNLTTSWNELNVSRAQWSIDAYCPKINDNNNRKCNACQAGWQFNSSCYATNNANYDQRKTWEEAQKDCRGKISDLAVAINEEEMKIISEKSWKNNENKGYWIGLRVEDGKWKWLDGRNLTNNSWIDQLPSAGHCAISLQNQGFKSVSCDAKNQWICKKKALSV